MELQLFVQKYSQKLIFLTAKYIFTNLMVIS